MDEKTEQTTSEIMMKIAAHYLFNGCNDCDFYKVAKICDARPLNCAYMKLKYFFEDLEEKEKHGTD